MCQPGSGSYIGGGFSRFGSLGNRRSIAVSVTVVTEGLAVLVGRGAGGSAAVVTGGWNVSVVVEGRGVVVTGDSVVTGDCGVAVEVTVVTVGRDLSAVVKSIIA
jgi:hypothetical protein